MHYLLQHFVFSPGYFEVLDFSKVGSKFVSDLYRPDLKIDKEDEIVFVYIGSSGCGYCNTGEHYQRMKTMKYRLNGWATDRDMDFLAIGIAKDYNVQKGVGHLNKNGKFDEIMAGNSWHGTGMLK